MKTRVAVARRRQREGPIDDVALSTLPSQTEQNELSRVLDEEIGRLPERYGVPVVLCELQGRSRQEVAMRLGIPEGTLSSRLASARRMLARSLKRRGVVLSAAILSTTLSELAANAVVSSVLIRSTAIAAFGDASGKVAHSRATALAEGVMRTMYLTKLKLVAATFASLIVAGIATSVLTAQTAPPVSKDLPKAPAENLVAAKPALAEKEKWQNLMEQIDPEKHTVGQGIWRLKEGKLTAYPAAHGARLRIPVVPNGNFEFRARWEAKDESSSVAFIVPHGERMASVELMTGFGCAGLGDLNGVRPNINETKTDIRIKPGKVHTVVIHVSTNGATIHVLAKLDDKKIVDWEGKRSELEHEFFAPQKPASLALGIGGQSSIFHSLELRMLSGTADAWKGDAAAAK
jgi:hypothetical protein